MYDLLFEAASNFSDFLFFFHFHGLKSRPNICILVLRCAGGVAEPKEPGDEQRTVFDLRPATKDMRRDRNVLELRTGSSTGPRLRTKTMRNEGSEAKG